MGCSSTAWICTTCPWRILAAARASRRKALACRRGGGELGRQDLDGNDPLQRFIEAADNDAEAALTEHFQDLVMPQPAKRAGLRCGRQEVQPRRNGIGGDGVFSCQFTCHQGRTRWAQRETVRHLVWGGITAGACRQPLICTPLPQGERGTNEGGRPLQDTGGLGVCPQQGLDPLAQLGIARTFPVEQGSLLSGTPDIDGGQENRLHPLGIDSHEKTLHEKLIFNATFL